jgi:hypothetical protein
MSRLEDAWDQMQGLLGGFTVLFLLIVYCWILPAV